MLRSLSHHLRIHYGGRFLLGPRPLHQHHLGPRMAKYLRVDTYPLGFTTFKVSSKHGADTRWQPRD